MMMMMQEGVKEGEKREGRWSGEEQMRRRRRRKKRKKKRKREME